MAQRSKQLEADGGSGGLTWAAMLWILAARGDTRTFANATANFVTRAVNPWGFTPDAVAAILSRIRRDPEARAILVRIATDNDHPSLRVSFPRLLLSTAESRVDGSALAQQLLSAELTRTGLPRFGLDALQSRLRPVSHALRESTEAV